MRGLFLVCVIAIGCDGSKPAPLVGAKPVDTTPVEKPIIVAAEKPAATSAEAKAAIAKLLDAHTDNNPKALDAFRNCTIERRGELDQGGATMNGSCKDHYSLPEKYRGDWQSPRRTVILVDKENVTFAQDGNTVATVPDSRISRSNLEDVWAQWMTILVPLVDEQRVLAAMVENNIRVWIGDQPPVVLLVNSKTGMLDKVVFEKLEDGRREVWAFTLSDYKPVKGVKLPHKVVYSPGRRAGATWTSIVYEPVASFPASTFTKP